MTKQRPPQGLEKLPPEVKTQLRAWLSSPEITYERAVKMLAEKFAVQTSITALNRFLCRCEQEALPGPAQAEPSQSSSGLEIVVTAQGASETKIQVRIVPGTL